MVTRVCFDDKIYIFRINFFRLCRIILEDVPDILRTLFRDEISRKYKRKWSDGQKWGRWLFQQEKFQSRLNGKQKSMLASGQTENWDISQLVHALLYSSQFLLANPFKNNCVNVKHNDPFKLVSTMPQTDFTQHLCRNDIILCDLGHELVRNEVKYVSQNDITLKYQIKSQNPTQITVYRCSKEWMSVEELSMLRNTKFAHCKNARIADSDLKRVVQRVETLYTDLGIAKPRIDSMSDIFKGNFCAVYYQ